MEDAIKVAGMTYVVKIEEYFKSHDDERNLWGLCDYEQQIIYIRKSLSEQKKKQVLIHELTLAMIHEAGYKEQDEELVERLSLVLYQVLNDNINLLNV